MVCQWSIEDVSMSCGIQVYTLWSENVAIVFYEWDWHKKAYCTFMDGLGIKSCPYFPGKRKKIGCATKSQVPFGL